MTDNTDMKELIKESMDRLAEIKKEMKLPDEWTDEDAQAVFEDVSHEKRMRTISKEKDKRTKQILDEKRVGKKYTEQKKVIKDTEIKKESDDKPEKKKTMNLGKRYNFTEKIGFATNKQLEFIQNLREQAKEGQLTIEVDVENVPKMTYPEADNEIKRIKEKLGWKDKKRDE